MCGKASADVEFFERDLWRVLAKHGLEKEDVPLRDKAVPTG